MHWSTLTHARLCNPFHSFAEVVWGASLFCGWDFISLLLQHPNRQKTFIFIMMTIGSFYLHKVATVERYARKVEFPLQQQFMKPPMNLLNIISSQRHHSCPQMHRSPPASATQALFLRRPWTPCLAVENPSLFSFSVVVNVFSTSHFFLIKSKHGENIWHSCHFNIFSVQLCSVGRFSVWLGSSKIERLMPKNTEKTASARHWIDQPIREHKHEMKSEWQVSTTRPEWLQWSKTHQFKVSLAILLPICLFWITE